VTFDEDQEQELHKLMLTAIEQTHRLTKEGMPLDAIKQKIIDALVLVTEASDQPPLQLHTREDIDN